MLQYWLDLQKPISRQLGLSLVDPLLYFCVKFYTPDPAQLEEEYTRYLFCLQVKRDLAQGNLISNLTSKVKRQLFRCITMQRKHRSFNGKLYSTG